MSAQQLADRCGALGMPAITRIVITRLENGRREQVSAAEISILAAALGVPPVELLFPVGRQQTTEALPGWEPHPLEALEWFTGERRLLASPTAGTWTLTTPAHAGEADETDIDLYRGYLAIRSFWFDWARALQKEELSPDADPDQIRRRKEQGSQIRDNLRRIRAEMARRGMLLPPLPEGLDLDDPKPGDGA